MRGVIIYYHPQQQKIYAINIPDGHRPEEFLPEISFYLYSFGTDGFLRKLTQITDIRDLSDCECVSDDDAPCDHPLYQNGYIEWFYLIDGDKIVVLGRKVPPVIIKIKQLLDNPDFIRQVINKIKNYEREASYEKV